MGQCQIIEEFEAQHKGKNQINFKVGDTVKVFVKIIEGQKERIQPFTGVVISIKKNRSFTLFRNAYGSSMERVFDINSPKITKIEILRHGDVRKSKLYYIKGKTGKKAKVKEKLHIKTKASKEVKENVVKESVEMEPVEVKKEETNSEEKKD